MKGNNFDVWKDWKWHLKNSVKSIKQAEVLTGIKFPPEHRKRLQETMEKFPMSVTPYYLSLIKVEDYESDPIYKQAFPDARELIIEDFEMSDPLSEDSDSPIHCITHRYPDRVLFHISNTCSMYCRHCTRKRKVGDQDSIPCKSELQAAIDYIAEHHEVRDVLLSGGDPFMLSDELIDWILGSLRSIEHVEVIRIGTRMPVVLPYRITDNLVKILKKHHPVWLNTHFNHPREVTSSSKQALSLLADAGIPLGNQTVLLSGINDCPIIMKSLVHKLVMNRVRPYYIYQCDLSEGLSHFRTPVSRGIEIMESMIGHTSGFAVPRYVVDAPGGGGKIPVMPNYIVSWAPKKVVLRNYEGVITAYREPDNYSFGKCELECDTCHLQLDTSDSDESKAVGIMKIISEYEDDISLIPENNSRMERRDSDDDES
ncbi:MAG: lysine 2,3-aminomutase [Spirochaetales bacterium]|nr:lysine 2,3-aminomutase [Spirochaetales bacterium]